MNPGSDPQVYVWASYGLTIVSLAAWRASMWWRLRQVRRQLEVLHEAAGGVQ